MPACRTLLGEVELDASIMDGKTLAAGAVGAVHNYEHVITLARKVMEELPHVLLVGPGAERFAAEMGMEQRDLMTEETHQQWREWLEEVIPAGAGRQRSGFRRRCASGCARWSTRRRIPAPSTSLPVTERQHRDRRQHERLAVEVSRSARR